MGSRARDSDPQMGIRRALVCLLGTISSVAAQNSIPLVAISAAPEAQTTLPPGELMGTYLAPDGSPYPVSCASGETIIVSSTYFACCLIGGSCEFGLGCDGRDVVHESGIFEYCFEGERCFGSTIFDKFPSPTKSLVDWGCVKSAHAIPTLYYEVDTNALSDIVYSYDFGSGSQDQTTIEITQHVTVTISSGTHTSIVTQPRPVSSSDTPPDNESTTGPVSSSSGSEDNSSTTTGYPAPASSTLPDIYDHPVVPETHARPASSRAWIAAVVAGPLLALVAVGGLLYWLRRHRQGKILAESVGSGPDIHAHEPPCIQADFEQSAELPGKTSDTPPMCELEATEVHQGPFQATGGAMRL